MHFMNNLVLDGSVVATLKHSLFKKVASTSHRQYSALAIIACGHDKNRKYLLQWNPKWNVFNLIGGKLDNTKGDNDSLVRTIRRELEEELGLRSSQEYRIVNELGPVQMRQFSRRERKMKDYHFAIFEIDVFPDLLINREEMGSVVRRLSKKCQNILVTKEEIRNLCTASGKPISKTTRRILQEVGDLYSPNS